MDTLDRIQAPIADELAEFWSQFTATLHQDNPLLQMALDHLLLKKGKMMRPTLMFLSARTAGQVNQRVTDAALALELLHTASLVHDDVVDESNRRRGQASVNRLLDNKAAVLVGDYLLSKALYHTSLVGDTAFVGVLSQAGLLLADGELLQLRNMDSDRIDEASYYEVVRKKTATLFAACGQQGVLLAGGSEGNAERMRQFGQLVGTCFQLRDDIFDFDISHDVGKPAGNDMREGKLTLPVIYAVRHSGSEEMRSLALKVRSGEATPQDISCLVTFTCEQGGINYAEWAMDEFRMMAAGLIDESLPQELTSALHLYVDFVAQRTM